jgi:vancomycin resistance protein YoaR
MTDLPNSSADRAANESRPEIGAPGGDPELAALVRRDVPAGGGDPELAALVSPGQPASVAPAMGKPADAAPTDTWTTPVLPVAAGVTDWEPQAPRRRRGRSILGFGVSFVLGLLLVFGIGAGVLYAWDQQYAGRVLPGVRVGSTELGGLTREQAQATLEDAYGFLETGQITLTGPDGKVTTISYADLGRGAESSALLEAALAAGRQDAPIANLISEAQTSMRGMTIDSTAAVAYDRAKLSAAIDTLATSIDQAPVDATVSAADGTFSFSPSADGRAVDKAALLTALDQQLAPVDAPASITMAVPVVSLAPAVTTATVEAAKTSADRMAADVVIARGEDSWTIAGKDLAPLISFSTAADGSIAPVLDASGLDPMLKTLAPKVKQTAQDAGLKLVGGKVVATGTSREGRTLDTAGTKAAIVSEIAARQTGVAPSPVAAVVKAVEPKLSAADAKSMASQMKVISSFKVWYQVIINNHFGGNIEAPATKIDGTVVPAGGVFDFWKVVGDLRKLPGTGPGNAIEGGKITVTGAFGGGICTTSTTLFNAAFRAGMVPMARKNHNEYITRYPAGLDATVFISGKTVQTMSFKNDTEYPILIQRVIIRDGGRRWLQFKIWSVPNGRTYKVTNVAISHGPTAKDTVVNDPTKPVGYTFRNNAPADGARVGVTVSIYDHGKLHWTKRYYSNYPAVDGVLIKGTRGA